MAKAGIAKVELPELMSRSDVVTIHTVLNSETKGLVGRPELARMKRSAFLINVSRGAIVDEAALVDALTSGSIAGAGLDVYSVEPGKESEEKIPLLLSLKSAHLAFTQ